MTDKNDLSNNNNAKQTKGSNQSEQKKRSDWDTQNRKGKGMSTDPNDWGLHEGPYPTD